MGNEKILLGWVIDSVRGTIHLPQHRVTRLTTMFQDVEGQRRVSRKRWRKRLGELRIMMLTIAGAESMFSHIQASPVNSGSSNCIKMDRSTRDELRDWKWLAEDIAARPTSIAEVVRHPLSISISCLPDGQRVMHHLSDGGGPGRNILCQPFPVV